MLQRIRPRLSFANIVSLIALSVALGGTSYAAIKLPRNSVGSAQIRTNAVKSSDISRNAVKSSEIAANSVTSGRVRNGTLLAKDFKAGQLPSGPAGPAGPTGASGAPGAAGAAGAPGAPGVVATTIIRRLDHTIADGATTATGDGNVECQPGEKPIGGGANLSDVNHGDAKITGSSPRRGTVAAPTVPADGQDWSIWRGTATNPAGGDTSAVTVRVYIICAPA